MSPAHSENGRGYIVPVGGAEEKIGDVTILRRFVALCGNGAADRHHPHRLEAERHRAPLRGAVPELGAGEAKSLPIQSRGDCDAPEWLEVLETANGIFITGGNQLRLTTILGGTPVAKAIRRRERARGARRRHAAGAAILSEHMIAFGEEGGSPPRPAASRWRPGSASPTAS